MKKRSVNGCGGPLPKTNVKLSGVNDHSVGNTVRGDKVMGNNVDSGVADPVPYETQLQGLVQVNGHDGVATYDGGCECCLISPEFATRANLQVLPHTSASLNDAVKRPIKAGGYVRCDVVIRQRKYQCVARVVKNLSSDIYLARPWLKRFNVSIHHGIDCVEIDRKLLQCAQVPKDCAGVTIAAASKGLCIPPNSLKRVKFKCTGRPKESAIYRVSDRCVQGDLEMVPELLTNCGTDLLLAVVNLSDHTVKCRGLKVILTEETDLKCQEIKNNEVPVIGGVSRASFERRLPTNESQKDIDAVLAKVKIGDGECSEEVREKVKGILQDHHPIFARHKWDIGRLKNPKYRHTIKLKKDAVPKQFKHYRVAQAEMQIVRKFVQRMKDAGLIEESSSQWACPLMLIAKRDDVNERRPVVNCKYLNSQQVCEATYLPRVDELLDRFTAGKKFLSKIDLCQFFFQTELGDKASRDICSFSTPIGHFSSNVMLMGDANAPNKSQKIIMDVLKDVDCAFALIDDIAICTDTIEEHLEALEKVFQKFLEAGLTLRPDKVEILVPELSYLGFTLRAGGRMEITDEKVDIVRKWPRCQSLTEVKSFLGFCSYVRRFVLGYSEVARPLFQVLKKPKWDKADWTPEVEKAFQDLKTAITNAPCLTIPTPGAGEYHLYSDASDYSCAFVLAQLVYDTTTKKRVLKPCVYGSRLFRGSEVNYSIAEKEVLGCCWSIKRLRPYLFGQTFILHTDNLATYHVLKQTGAELMTSRLARFAFDVMDYHFHVRWVRSEKNWADGLTRLPVVAGPNGELKYRFEDEEELALDPNPPPKPLKDAEIDPLWAGAVTRQQTVDKDVAPGFVANQKKDEEIQEIVKDIEESAEKKVKRGAVVFKMNQGVLVMVDKKRRVRYVIPKNMIDDIIKKEHTEAHRGMSKTLEAVSRLYYWPGWCKDVAAYVKGCFVCQTNKRHVPTYPPLSDLPRPTRGQQIAAIDVKGEVVPASNGKKFIIVVVDMFTRYAWTKAVPRVDGITVTNFLVDEVMQPMGKFDMLISDNASNLKHGIAGFMYPQLDVEPRNSLPYFAQTNGGVERLIGTLGMMIRCATDGNPQWSRMVPKITTIYNNTVHRATGYSPQHLHMGYAARPLPRMESEVPLHPVDAPTRYLLDMRERRAEAERAVLEGLKTYYADAKARVDEKRNASSHRFYVGQYVLVKKLGPRPSKALGPLYEGPAEVIAVTRSSCKVVFLNTNIIAKRAVSHLKPFYEARGTPTPIERYTGPQRGEHRDEEDGTEEQEETEAIPDPDGQEPEGEPMDAEIPGEEREEDEERADLADDDVEPEETGEGADGTPADPAEEQEEDRPQEEDIHRGGRTVTFNLPPEDTQEATAAADDRSDPSVGIQG